MNEKEGRDEKKIYLVKIGKDDKGITDYLKRELAVIYPFEFVCCEMQIEFENAFNPIRKQYLSTPFLLQLVRERPKDALVVLGIFDGDLYADGLNFIFGQAEPSQGVAIISIYRLRDEFYFGEERMSRLKMRALKEAVHEIGHLFGLSHCWESFCVMFFSNSIVDTDRKSCYFCRSCESKLRKIIKYRFE